MKEYGQTFITFAVTAAWCAMWFTGWVFPTLLHAAFGVVLAFNGYQKFQDIQISKAMLKVGNVTPT